VTAQHVYVLFIYLPSSSRHHQLVAVLAQTDLLDAQPGVIAVRVKTAHLHTHTHTHTKRHGLGFYSSRYRVFFSTLHSSLKSLIRIDHKPIQFRHTDVKVRLLEAPPPLLLSPLLLLLRDNPSFPSYTHSAKHVH